MADYNFTKCSILIDSKKYRIRIHKNTLSSIGTPDNILLLVNPKERTLVIQCSNNLEPLALCISKSYLAKRKSIELYSRSLVKSILDICTNWQDNQSYLLYGKTILKGGVALFHLDESNQMKGAEL